MGEKKVSASDFLEAFSKNEHHFGNEHYIHPIVKETLSRKSSDSISIDESGSL